ncbi:MAG: PQQ-binding-like beta-propeller repeat protein, partial [Gemmatimonadaceae bacterium]
METLPARVVVTPTYRTRTSRLDTWLRLGWGVLLLTAGTACRSTTGPKGERPGSAIWVAPPGASSQPVADDSAVYFTTSAHGVVSVARSTGRERWSASTHATTSMLYSWNSVVAGDVLAVSDYDVYGFDRATGALRWQFDPAALGLPGYGPGALGISTDGRYIYTGSASGHAYGIDAESGKAVWYIVIANDGNSSVFQPVIDDSMLYVRVTHFGNPNAGDLVALERATGAIRWSRSFVPSGTSGSDLSGVAVLGGLIFVSVADGTIRAVSKTSTSEVWVAPRLPSLTARDDLRTLIVADDVLVATSTTDNVTGYDPTTGQTLWQTDAGEGSSDNPLATDGRFVYVIYVNGVLGSLDARTGAV